MFEKFLLTNFENHATAIYPEYVRVGKFVVNKDEKIPVLIPIDPATFNSLHLVTYNDSEKGEKQLQYMALDLMARMKPELARFTFIDMDLQTSFPYLANIKSEQVHFVTTHEQLDNEINRLYERFRYIDTKCLAGKHRNLTDYNKNTEYKEQYNFVFIPKHVETLFDRYDERGKERLKQIVVSGGKCGIYFFIIEPINSHDHITVDYTINKICRTNNEHLNRLNRFCERYGLAYEEYDYMTIDRLVQGLYNEHRDDNGRSDFLSIPIGRCGNEMVSLRMGEKSGVYHGFIAGQTGTGKSNLLNKIITSVAEQYSPDDLRLFLLDYKQGVEFGVYKNHPNVEYLMLDNKNFKAGADTLQFLWHKLEERSLQMNQAGCRDIDSYNVKNPTQRMPRILTIVDEVQKLFSYQDFEIRRDVKRLVNDLSRQGRAFGIHLLFCSQSYVNCDIDSDILAQMPLRISFSLATSSECRAIMGSDNYAPMSLERYCAIYNDHNGAAKYNIVVRTERFDEGKRDGIFEQARKEYADAVQFEQRVIENVPKNSATGVSEKTDEGTNSDQTDVESKYENVPTNKVTKDSDNTDEGTISDQTDVENKFDFKF